MFSVVHRDAGSQARTGVVEVSRGRIRTPAFMPVGTQGTVKGISSKELEEIGPDIILGNTYHLYLRPGEAVIRNFGGLGAFMNWKKPVLTDSGGFQIFSLSMFSKVKAGGIEFQSHLDGSKHFLSPEDVIRLQSVLGSDILMPLDECVKYPADRDTVERSLPITLDWARRSAEAWRAGLKQDAYGHPNFLFGIVQGGGYADLRKRCAEELCRLDLPGYAIGGLSVGEPNSVMYEILSATLPELPADKPRYLMGVGMPADLFEAVSQGVDMFDCVIPTRNGRHATVFTKKGRLVLKGASFKEDPRPIEEDCPCFACRTHTRAYVRHLFDAGEPLGGRLASLHNLTFFIELLDSMRRAIGEDRFTAFRREFESQFNAGESRA